MSQRNSDTDHQTVLAYMGSPQWEARLAEARKKRAAIESEKSNGNVAAEAEQRERIMGSFREFTARENAPQDKLIETHSRSASTGFSETETHPEAPVLTQIDRANFGSAFTPLVYTAITIGLLSSGGVTFLSFKDQEVTNVDFMETPQNAEAMSALQIPASPVGAIERLAASLIDISADYSVTVVATPQTANALSEFLPSLPSGPEVQTTSFAMPRHTVSYYHLADAEAAKALAEKLHGETLNLTGFQPQRNAGKLSIHLSES